MPASAWAWGYEGHEVVADIARAYLKPEVIAKIDALLATDQDNSLTGHDMLPEATWADRRQGHRRFDEAMLWWWESGRWKPSSYIT